MLPQRERKSSAQIFYSKYQREKNDIYRRTFFANDLLVPDNSSLGGFRYYPKLIFRQPVFRLYLRPYQEE